LKHSALDWVGAAASVGKRNLPLASMVNCGAPAELFTTKPPPLAGVTVTSCACASTRNNALITAALSKRGRNAKIIFILAMSRVERKGDAEKSRREMGARRATLRARRYSATWVVKVRERADSLPSADKMSARGKSIEPMPHWLKYAPKPPALIAARAESGDPRVSDELYRTTAVLGKRVSAQA